MSSLRKRAWSEYNILKGLNNDLSSKFILDSSPFDAEDEAPTNYTFTGRIFPKTSPFNESAFKIELKLTDRYPAKAPEVRMLTHIHHPNVTEKGNRKTTTTRIK
jgi:ubiquitin-protein ligase